MRNFSLLPKILLFLSAIVTKGIASNNFLIVANGQWEEATVRSHMSNRIIIALDGAAVNLYKSSIKPDFVIGDLDSIEERVNADNIDYFNATAALSHFSRLPTPNDTEVIFEKYETSHPLLNGQVSNITYVRTKSQNFTDLDKGIRFCLQSQTNENKIDITVACALGGDRIDHFLGNFSVLKKYHAPKFPNVSLRLINCLQIVEFLKDEEISFTAKAGDKFGLFGFPEASAITEGLRWELDESYKLKIGGKSSSCNEILKTTVKIKIKGEALMMRPLNSQIIS